MSTVSALAVGTLVTLSTSRDLDLSDCEVACGFAVELCSAKGIVIRSLDSGARFTVRRDEIVRAA